MNKWQRVSQELDQAKKWPKRRERNLEKWSNKTTQVNNLNEGRILIISSSKESKLERVFWVELDLGRINYFDNWWNRALNTVGVEMLNGQERKSPDNYILKKKKKIIPSGFSLVEYSIAKTNHSIMGQFDLFFFFLQIGSFFFVIRKRPIHIYSYLCTYYNFQYREKRENQKCTRNGIFINFLFVFIDENNSKRRKGTPASVVGGDFGALGIQSLFSLLYLFWKFTIEIPNLLEM